jgi:hypothetical protein
MIRFKALRAINVLELAVALTVLVIIAAFAGPRFSRAATTRDVPPLKVRLELLRNAIERYCYDHVAWPGQKGDGTNAAGTTEAFQAQLTQYSDADGFVSDVMTNRFRYGPYLREGVPACPVEPCNDRAAVLVISGAQPPHRDAEHPDAGWIFNCSTGVITANSDVTDADGIRYDDY